MFSPVYPNDPMADKILRIDHPSVPDLRFTIEDANSNIKETRNERFQGIEQRKRQKDEGWDAFVTPSEERFYETNLRAITAMEAERDRFQKFLDDRSYLLGPVFAGSGLYRRRERVAGQEFMLDWALIRIRQERLGENKVWLTLLPYYLKLWLILSDKSVSSTERQLSNFHYKDPLNKKCLSGSPIRIWCFSNPGGPHPSPRLGLASSSLF